MSDGEKEETKKAGEETPATKEKEEDVDEKVFEQSTDLFENNTQQGFQCTNPTNKGGHYYYKCKGVD